MKVRIAPGAAICVLFVPNGWCQRAPVRSPEIAPDRMVTFRVAAPKATEVTISGEFLKDSKALAKDANGIWSVTVGPIEPEIYNYAFMIDGVKTLDPGNPNVKTGSTPSTIASILEVRGDQPAFYDGHPVPHGEIRTAWYQSKSLGALRRFTVYTPPDYDHERGARYPVLYLFHGANADETAWTRLGRLNLILDNLLAAGKTKPFLVVMPFGYGIPPGAPRPSTGDPSSNDLFSRDLIGDVIPLVDARYRTTADRAHRAIIGLSMGGEQSLTIGLGHLDLFAWVGGFSAALPVSEFSRLFPAVAHDAQAANRKLSLLWIGCGKDDSLITAAQAFDDYLNQHQVRHIFRQSEGAHTWIVWRRYLNEVAPLLFR